MRGDQKTLSRPNGSRLAFFAALSVLAAGLAIPAGAKAKSSDYGGPGQGTAMTPTQSTGDSVAYAIPRNAPSPDVEIVLPQPLSPSDVALYQRILQLQDQRDYTAADTLAARLSDNSLMGSVLAERYLSPHYITSPAELQSWWAQYSATPDAPAIYGLMRIKMRHAGLPAPPQTALLPETTMTAGAAAHPAMATEGGAWYRGFHLGLDYWQSGDLQKAAHDFSVTAAMDGISDDDRAASEFWAARAALRLQQPEQYLDDLHEAAAYGSTFYGMLAGRLLGQGFGPTGIAATLTEADITAVDSTPQGHAAFMLLQIGRKNQAEDALRALWPQIQQNPDLGHAVMAVAARAGLVDVTIALAARLPSPVDEIAGARLPLPAMHPEGGFSVDPALLYALTRTESGFDADALSRCGARGLMQLMPETANTMRKAEGVYGALTDPSANLAMGQAYLRYLGTQPGINGNLLAILASYNAGPGAAAAWYSQLKDDSDPLLFIETIPTDETRQFVRQVLADSWLYAEEIGTDPESLDELAEGGFPVLHDFGSGGTMTAALQ